LNVALALGAPLQPNPVVIINPNGAANVFIV
jgi:hypothetical protein